MTLEEASPERGAQKTLGIDPICGMTVRAPARWTYAFQGREYFFCNPKCLEKFKADPARALAPKAASLPVDVSAYYICPMDPEIRQQGPGTCPKCGMALEPEMVGIAEEENHELREMKGRLLIGASLTIPLFALSMGDMLLGHRFSHALGFAAKSWIEAALAWGVVVGGGAPILARGYRSLQSRHLNMFTLISLGVVVAMASSMFALLYPQGLPDALRGMHERPIYFEAAAVIITLALVGQVLELSARARTGDALRALLNLAPKTALRESSNGGQEEVPVGSLVEGDLIRILPGQTAAADGRIVEGKTQFDESMVTGESVPVARGPGDWVVGGTLNGLGAVLVRVERVGEHSTLQTIARRVAEAQRSRAPIQRLVDRVSAVFVPVVVVAAFVTFLIWWAVGPEPRLAFAIVNAMSVLIVACPCALGLATPMSLTVGMGRGAGIGVLFRDAEALERMTAVNVLVVDKTGTLTHGTPSVVGSEVHGGSLQEVLSFVGSVERGSGHPLAGAIVRAATESGAVLYPAEDLVTEPGQGVRGRVRSEAVTIGSEAFVGAQFDLNLQAFAERMRSTGHTVVLAKVGTRLAAALALADPIRESSRDAVRSLQAAGVRVVMATGDSAPVAKLVSGELGIAEVFAGVTPQGKAEHVLALQKAGNTVAMAGDGINDAPALAQADVGIAMGVGADVAKMAAHVTLLGTDLTAVRRTRELSRAVMRNIRQNLVFAFGYNALGIPLAAGILYPALGILMSPMVAAVLMSFSSASVIANALRLKNARLAG